MKYLPDIRAAQSDPESLEQQYRAAQQQDGIDEFGTDVLTCYQECPDNLLYAAWYHRLLPLPQAQPADRKNGKWKLAILFSVIVGLIFWALSDPRIKLSDDLPYLTLLWAPIAACFAIAFLTLSAKRLQKRSLLVVIGVICVATYAMLWAPLVGQRDYRFLMVLHLPLLAWAGLGLSILGRRSDPQTRFAFLIKSIEVAITAGIYLAAGGVFAGITFGMFGTLGVSIPEAIMRLVQSGGIGLIPVLAVATVYDPHLSPIQQRFDQGLSRLISTLMRLLLPLTLLVLIAYLIAIPFNFMAPFGSRDVLIVYNVMLFAIMALLLGAAPVFERGLSPRYHAALRTGMLAVAILAVIISLYALSATVYRTALGGVTVNRLAVIGWNCINIGILCLLVYRQLKDGATQWLHSLQQVFSAATTAYVVWGMFLILTIPVLFQ